MTAPATIVVHTGHAFVLVDYRTGRAELHASMPAEHSDPVVDLARRPRSWGTEENSAVLSPLPACGLMWRLLCVPAIAVTAVVLHTGPRRFRMRRLVALARLGRALPPAPVRHVRAAVAAVHATSAFLPGRWACLEQSVAAAFLLALAGRRAEWCHGVASDPVRLHAWIVDPDGRPVGEGPDINAFTPVLTPDGPAGPTQDTEPETTP
ncbi:lasso peptide biosynthesis B2 protein [Nocardiopsis sp. ATB16-24]|uniref:lasso peptide biosynthesis B2 protein n=1 Tax=Nocardiopsis sp. ATB16-24 TaxID=3019555 RepID=UPI002552879F|nr:lasso peptide biosynthesis B2 protein [Nocardiopsis sp. ATB16-24]